MLRMWLSPSQAGRLLQSHGRGAVRSLHSRRTMKHPANLPRSLLSHLPTRQVPPSPTPELDPDAYQRSPVTSAHAIDLVKGEVSSLDSAAVSPSGGVVHGRYGDLGAAAETVPLEYLALLRHAAEGVAALKALGSSKTPGTVLIFGAGQANGLAALQLAKEAGHAVVAVVGAEQSHSEDMLEYVKSMVPEPGTAVAEEYAIAKKNFADLVQGVSTGDEGLSCYSADECLEEFKTNLLEYCKTYPESLPAAVDPAKMKFLGMDKDKDSFRSNMEAYLAQFPPGAPPLDPAQLDANFTNEQYDVFRNKFWEQTTNVISGDESHFFSPPHIVRDLLKIPGKANKTLVDKSFPVMPFGFTHDKPVYPEGTEAVAGGPIAGAIISVTPNLEEAAKKIDAAKGLREKGEALAFLTDAQKSAFSAAASVVANATKAGAPIVTIGGSLPGLTSVEATTADAQEAVEAMSVQEDGSTNLDFFIQAYRAGDFPFYEDYAVHRATEALAGPRQIVVTK